MSVGYFTPDTNTSRSQHLHVKSTAVENGWTKLQNIGEKAFTKKPRSWPFCLASFTRLDRNVRGVSRTNSSKSITSFLSMSARLMIVSTCSSPIKSNPMARSALRISFLSSVPFPSLSAASNIFRSTIWPNGLSDVSTKEEMTFVCCAITSARSLFSSFSPMTLLLPITRGAKMPLLDGRRLEAFGVVGFALGSSVGADDMVGVA
mmetsp:Transcript_474/g.1303  ORF Transcript_474/g.1303 Transcript_474/m.1303 type:complete len:205 (+) Transcript_474:320-934(+)